MFTAVTRVLATLALFTGPVALRAQVKVTVLPAAADVAPFYADTGWSNLHGRTRLTTPLLNLTFVTNSGFNPSTRDAADRGLPASLRLTGLQPADFQDIANAAHDALIAELKAQGLDVMAYDPLSVNPGFQELARRAPRTGREQPVPEAYQTIAGISGARQTMTFVGHRCPWVESFMLATYLPAARLTRELDSTLPVVSFLVEFVAYSADRNVTFDWGRFMPGTPAATVPALRAYPQVYLSAGSVALLTPDGQTAALTLNAPLGYEKAFVSRLAPTRGRTRAERKGGSYEVAVDPAAYKQAAIDLLKAQVVAIARRVAAGAQ